MTTQKQILANKTNAVLSTGPNDTTKTRYNSIKFGIFTKDFLIDKNIKNEDIKEFYALLNGLYQEYNPQTETEKILVERIAECCWKLKRLRKAEKAVLSKMLISVDEDVESDLDFKENVVDNPLFISKDIDTPTFTLSILKKLCKKKENDIEQIKNNECSIEKLKEELIISDETYKEHIHKLSEEEIKIKGLDHFKRGLKFYSLLLEMKEKERESFKKIESDIRLVLPESYLKNFTTYETTIERQMCRAIMMLRQIKNNLL